MKQIFLFIVFLSLASFGQDKNISVISVEKREHSIQYIEYSFHGYGAPKVELKLMLIENY